MALLGCAVCSAPPPSFVPPSPKVLFRSSSVHGHCPLVWSQVLSKGLRGMCNVRFRYIPSGPHQLLCEGLGVSHICLQALLSPVSWPLPLCLTTPSFLTALSSLATKPLWGPISLPCQRLLLHFPAWLPRSRGLPHVQSCPLVRAALPSPGLRHIGCTHCPLPSHLTR